MMNPWVIVGFMLALAGAGSGGFYLGYELRDGEAAKDSERDQRFASEVRSANLSLASLVTESTIDAIGQIKVQHTTVNSEVRHEKEVHHVLTDINCALPVSTLWVLNRARGYDDSGPPAGGPTPRMSAPTPPAER